MTVADAAGTVTVAANAVTTSDAVAPGTAGPSIARRLVRRLAAPAPGWTARALPIGGWMLERDA